jgi:tRNA(Ile)-lysidine synthase
MLADRVLRTVRRHRMIPDGGRVLIALSGGPDSVALALLMREIAAPAPLALAGLVHVNHGLRERASVDEAFCGQLAAELAVPFKAEHVDVRALARERRLSLEDAGRKARYAIFERVRVELGADVVATGHSRDDQAETFLLRLIRGSGLRGLAGIYPVAGRVVRPLIDVSRADLRQYLADRAQPFCEDETNLDREIPRNRVRHELLPYLARAFSPGIAEVLAREAELARVDADRLDREAIDLASLIVLRDEHGNSPLDLGAAASASRVELDVEALRSLHPALASRVAHLALGALAPDKFVGYQHAVELLALAGGPDGGSVSLPGQHAVRRAGRIVLTRAPFRPFENSFRVPLSIPGEVTLAAQGWAVSALPGGADLSAPAGRERLVVSVQADRIALPLAVRSRRRGDRFRPPGLGGREKKLQDVLVDRKIARETRDSLPLVVDGEDRIVWIVGGSVAEDFQVTEPSQGVIFLKARRLGGPG